MLVINDTLTPKQVGHLFRNAKLKKIIQVQDGNSNISLLKWQHKVQNSDALQESFDLEAIEVLFTSKADSIYVNAISKTDGQLLPIGRITADIREDNDKLNILGELGNILTRSKELLGQKLIISNCFLSANSLDVHILVQEQQQFGPWSLLLAQTEALKVLLRFLLHHSADLHQQHINVDYFYKCLNAPKNTQEASILHQDEYQQMLKRLTNELHPFQKESVQWMIEREKLETPRNSECKCKSNFYKSNLCQCDQNELLPPTWHSGTNYESKMIYFNLIQGIISTSPKIAKNISTQQAIKGGILADEMGLGKTVEVIALILLNPFDVVQHTLLDEEVQIRQIKSTLIIAPAQIVEQWLDEFATHAPSLNVYEYKGIKNNEIVLSDLSKYDVVIVNYNVLAAELWHVDIIERDFRQEKKYKVEESLLTQLKWWRVVLDESQMLEKGVSHAATVVSLIPRHISWAVSGTPIKKNLDDLHGLLKFLRLEPYASSIKVWNVLINQRYLANDFASLFSSSSIACRHTKIEVRNQVKLPSQTRSLNTLQFTAIERFTYRDLLRTLTEECGLDMNGVPLNDPWNLNDHTEKLRRGLYSLRQTCCHPMLGSGRNLTGGATSLSTMDEVLHALLQNAKYNLTSVQRDYCTAIIEQGRIYDAQKKAQKALDLYKSVLDIAKSGVSEAQAKKDQSTYVSDKKKSDQAQEDYEAALIIDIRFWQELLHQILFLIASANFVLKNEEEETKYYNEAKVLRKSNDLSKKIEGNKFTMIPEFMHSQFSPGIKSDTEFRDLAMLTEIFNEQADQIDVIRNKLVDLLQRSAFDEDVEEPTGEELDNSVKLQDECLLFREAIRDMLRDRSEAVSGLRSTLTENQEADVRRVHQTETAELAEKLAAARKMFSPKKRGITLKSLQARFKNIRREGEGARVGSAARTESIMARTEEARLGLVIKEQNDAIKKIEEELPFFFTLIRTRTDYYRQIQRLSDKVLELGEISEPVATLKLLNFEKEERKSRKNIQDAESRVRYLTNLSSPEEMSEEAKTCRICFQQILYGAMTPCGHLFCNKCLNMWFTRHSTCPSCLKNINRHYNPIAFGANDELQTKSSTSVISSQYTGMNDELLQSISDQNLKGPSWGSKIDSLVKHLLWLRANAPDEKSVVFSQWQDVQKILQKSLKTNGLRYGSLDDRKSLQQFRNDPEVRIFMLNSQTKSAGLTLVNAVHVFLLEPLVHSSIELQAISRIHRIGQTKPTHVWLYAVTDTVEENILGVASQGQDRRDAVDKSKEVFGNLDNGDQSRSLANIITSSGEIVADNYLWNCLFGEGSPNLIVPEGSPAVAAEVSPSNGVKEISSPAELNVVGLPNSAKEARMVLTNNLDRQNPTFRRELMAAAAEERSRKRQHDGSISLL